MVKPIQYSQSSPTTGHWPPATGHDLGLAPDRRWRFGLTTPPTAQWPLITLLLLTLALFATQPAFAQVRNAPAGNSLPEPEAPPAAAPGASSLPPSLAPLVQSTESQPAEEAAPPAMDRATHAAFAARVDLSKFRKLAVFDAGRAKIIDTMAREFLVRVYGKERWKDTEAGEGVSYDDPVFTLLDMTFNKPYYFDKPVIYVEVLPLRRQIVAANVAPDQQEKWLHLGRLTPDMVASAQTRQVLMAMEADLISQKALSQMRLAVTSFGTPEATFFLVSPDAASDHWASLLSMGPDGREIIPPTVVGKSAVTADPVLTQKALDAFQRLHDTWAKADAAGVNAALDELCATLPQLNPPTYTASWVRDAERIYNLTQKFTIGYVAYLFGMIIFLVAFGAQRKWLIRTGVALLLTGIAIHLAGFIVRMILAGRWAIHNQYESFIFITLASVIVGTIAMFARRQWLFGAAACAMGAVSLLVANTVDIPSREVGQVAGILATSRILYIHVNMVLVSYGLIALGFFISLFYLIAHYGQGGFFNRFTAAGLGKLPETLASPQVAMATPASPPVAQSPEGTKPSGSAGTSDAPAAPPLVLLKELDHAQMVIFQLAFYILGVGILLGAYWADHAWGRWWAWDPKETWALITWIIYLMVIHVRFTVKDRGLATAWLGVIGFLVMLWCYWGVNMFLAGLHSYA